LNEIEANGRITLKQFGTILSDLKMLSELKTNDAVINEAWKTFSVEAVDDTPEENVKKFCIKVFQALS
jgi:hypothetical protein